MHSDRLLSLSLSLVLLCAFAGVSECFAPNFVASVFLPGYYDTLYSSSNANRTYDSLQQTGANCVTLSLKYAMTNVSSATVFASSGNTATNASLASAISYIKSLNMDVMLGMELYLTADPNHWSGDIGTGYSDTQWTQFFSSYTTFARVAAEIARDNGVKYLSLGLEIDNTLSNATGWNTLINAVRGIFPGKIGYVAGEPGFSSSSWFPRLDYITMSTWYYAPEALNTNIQEYKMSWISYLQKLRMISSPWKIPVFLRVGYPSTITAFQQPWMQSGTPNTQVQQYATEAALEAMQSQGTWLAGIVYNQQNVQQDRGACGTSDDVLGKPVRNTIRQWFAAISSPSSNTVSCPLIAPYIPDYNVTFDIFTDNLTSPMIAFSYGSVNNFSASYTQQAYNSTRSIYADLNQGTGFAISTNPSSWNLTPYQFLEFYIRSTATISLNVYFSVTGFNGYQLALDACGYAQDGVLGGGSIWKKVIIPLQDMYVSGRPWVNLNFEAPIANAKFNIDDIRLIGGKLNTSCPQNCGDYVTCGTCTSTPGCGWCASSMTCMSGNAIEPDSSGYCPSWKTASNQCSSTVVADPSCSTYTDCFACTNDPFCGWCRDNQKCMAGHANGNYGNCSAFSFYSCHATCTDVVYDEMQSFNQHIWSKISLGSAAGGGISSVNPYNTRHVNNTKLQLVINNTPYLGVAPAGGEYGSLKRYGFGRFSLRAKLSGVTGSQLVFTTYYENGSDVHQVYIKILAGNVVTMDAYLASRSLSLYTSKTLNFNVNDGQFHLFEYDWSATTAAFFVDGNNIANLAAATMPTQPGILYIHHQAGSNFAYPGSEVVAEIDWIKFCPAGCNCTGGQSVSPLKQLTTQSTVSQATNYVMTVAPSLIRNPEYQVSITRNPVAGSVVVDAANNRFLYNNSNNRVSSDSYQYRVTDGTREILQMEVSLDLTPIYIPPVSTTGAVTTASPSSSATATGSNIVTENNGISNIGIIAGVAGGGGALLLIILIVVVIVVMRRRKNNRDEEMPHNSYNGNNAKSSNYDEISMETTNYSVVPSVNHSNVSINGSNNNNNSSNNRNVHSGRQVASTKLLPKPTSWEISYDDLRIISEIGRGSFGQVYVGTWREAPVAIKCVLNMEEKLLEEFRREAELMKSIRPHPNVVLFQGLCIHDTQTMIVTEYLEGGNLYEYVLNHENKMDKALTFKFLKGIAAGMLHISSEGLVHRDLAARNILLTQNLDPKVSDFGLSRVVEEEGSGGKTESNVGPLRWMAPESLTKNEYSTKSDIWSFGVVMYEILERQEPHKGRTPAQVAVGVANGTLSLTIDTTNSPPYKAQLVTNVMQSCLRRDAALRPTWKDLCAALYHIETTTKN